MKRFFTLLTIAFLGIGTLQAQWQRLRLNAGHENENFNVYSNYFNYYGVCCITENTVYACGDSGIILKSTNGGNGWKLKHFDETETITALGFANKRIGYAGGYKTVDGSQQNILLKTVDYGNTWEEIPTTIDFSFEIENTGSERKFVVLSPDTLFVYNKMNVFRSIDGGQTFNVCYESNYDYYDFYSRGVKGLFFDDSLGFVVNYGSSSDTTRIIKVKKTTDYGDTWTEVGEFSVTGIDLFEGDLLVNFVDKNHVRFNQNGHIIETTDGFETVSQLQGEYFSGSIGGPFDCKFNSSDFGCYVSNMTMDCLECDRTSSAFVTTDGGLSWHDELQENFGFLDKYSYYRYMFAVDGIDSVFYVVSEDGAGYRYGTLHQEEEPTFASQGSEWYFNLSSFMGSPVSYYKMEVHGDTLVQGHTCSIITPPYLGSNGGNQYVYEENKVVYWYNATTDSFTTLYDFNANEGESWICDIDSCSYQVSVTSIDSVTWEGHTYRVQNVTSESPIQIMYGKIIDGIGYEQGLFPYMWACDDVVYDGEYPYYLRCYFKDGEMLYHEGGFACDEMTYCWDGSVAENYAGGDGTAENPYKIATERQLALLAQQTNDGTGGDAYYELTNDLSLGTCDSESHKWTPIGNTEIDYDGGEIDTVFRYFTGHFDGKGHSIINMVQTSDLYQLAGGLFGCTKGAEIRNLNLVFASVSGSGNYVGGLVGHAGNTNIVGCSVYEVSVSTENAATEHVICAGGLVGYAGVPLGTSDASSDTCRIENCRTDIPSTVEGIGYTGGIVGAINKNGDTNMQTPYKVINCTVGTDYYTDSFTVKGQQTTGGIAGFVGNAVVSGCKNYYKVEGGLNGGPNEWGVAGIVGEVSYPSSIDNCTNYGSVMGKRFAGGIVGISQHVYDILVTNCTNWGEVTASHNGGVYAGGIVGKGHHLSLNRCANRGNIKAITGRCYVSVGGLVAEGGTVANSYNRGNVTAEVETFDEDTFEGIYAGGISGVGTPCNVYNTGTVIIPEIPENVMISAEPIVECGIVVGFTGGKRFNCYWLNNSDLPACGNTDSPNIPGSSSFHAGETSTSWVLNDAQYGTTDLLEALNSGALTVLDSMPQFPLICLWEEDINLTNNGYPIFGEEIVYDTASYPMAGKEWYYELQNPDGSITYQHLYYLADTVIDDRDIDIIVRNNTLYDKGSVTTHEYIYEESGKVYWWNATTGDFTTLYDFTANVGDEWEIKVGTESITMHVDAVGETEYNNHVFKTLQVSDAGNLFSGTIVSSVGHLTSFFPEKLMRKQGESSVEGLRCLWNGMELVFKYGDKDCDEVYEQLHLSLSEATTNSFSLYPNPTEGQLSITAASGGEYRITNLTGQTLLQGRLNSGNTSIDVSGLCNGMYFMTIEGSTKKFLVQ